MASPDGAWARPAIIEESKQMKRARRRSICMRLSWRGGTGMKLRWAMILIAMVVLAENAKRPITENDLYAFQWAASPQISPDGSKIVYALVKVTAKHDNYETALWMAPATGGPARQVTSGPHDSSAQWSPDGKVLAFLRATEKDGKPEPPQIYLLAMEGGEARALTDIPKGAGA